MNKLSLKSSVIFVGALLLAFSVNVSSASAQAAYTNQQIQDALVACLNAGMSNADIAAAATSLGITQDQIATAVSTYPGVSAETVATISTTVATAYAGVIAVEVPNPAQLTTTQVSSVLQDTSLTPEQQAAALAQGGVSAADVVSQYHVTDPATIANINAAYANQTVVQYQGTTYYTSGGSTTPVGVYAANPNGNGVVNIGTFNSSDGNLVAAGSTTSAGNLSQLVGTTVSATTVGGTSISETIDGHSYAYLAGMASAGYAFLNAYNDFVAGGLDINSAAYAAMQTAKQQANATVAAESGGTQQTITVVMNANGTLSYGCINSQNTTLYCPVGKSLAANGLCVSTAKTSTTSTAPTTTTAPVTTTAPTASGTCPDGSLYDTTNASCVACSNGGCGGRGGTSAPGDAVGAVFCLNTAINPTACDQFLQTSGPNAPTVTLTATPSSVDAGQPAKLTWSSTNTKTCTAVGGFGVSYSGAATSNASGVSVTPPSTSTYQIACVSPDGFSALSNATVTVLQPSIDSFTASAPRVNAGRTVTLTWAVSDAQSCSISGPEGVVATGKTGNQAITVNEKSTFTLTCQTNGAPIKKSVEVNVNVSKFEMF